MRAHPTTHDIAAAIVAACRQTGEDFEDVLARKRGIRARRYAYEVLHEAFPAAPKMQIARLVGGRDVNFAFKQRESWYEIPVRNRANAEFKRLGGGSAGLGG